MSDSAYFLVVELFHRQKFQYKNLGKIDDEKPGLDKSW